MERCLIFNPARSFNVMYSCSIHFETGHDRLVFTLEILIDHQWFGNGKEDHGFRRQFERTMFNRPASAFSIHARKTEKSWL
jgi:hypothetical protein